MSLFLAELRKVWGNRLFPLLLAVLAAANLLLLWMGTRPTAGQPSAAAYRTVGTQLDGLTMEEKGAQKLIRGMVPLGEMFGYATALRSMSQGRAGFTMQFEHYEAVPFFLTEQIIKARRAANKIR